MVSQNNNWFASWFDSPYYHLLYQNRNDGEAQFFMTNLINHLNPTAKNRTLDLACGKGRHAIFLAQQGLDVTGVDLSPKSILHAKQFETDRLHFDTHDMRKPIQLEAFDYIFNLFTSFGYFETFEEHAETLGHMRNALKTDKSILVIDFFNAHKVIKNLVLAEEKQIEGITFNLNRRVDNGKIIKEIRFEDKGQTFNFEECVQAFTLRHFKELFESAGLKLTNTFGSYALTPYDREQSDRLIMLLTK